MNVLEQIFPERIKGIYFYDFVVQRDLCSELAATTLVLIPPLAERRVVVDESEAGDGPTRLTHAYHHVPTFSRHSTSARTQHSTTGANSL